MGDVPVGASGSWGQNPAMAADPAQTDLAITALDAGSASAFLEAVADGAFVVDVADGAPRLALTSSRLLALLDPLEGPRIGGGVDFGRDNWRLRHHPDDGPEVEARLVRLLRREETAGEGRLLTAAGDVRLVGVVEDFTPSRRHAVTPSRVAADAADMAVWRWYPDRDEAAVEYRGSAMASSTPEQPTLQGWLRQIVPEDRERVARGAAPRVRARRALPLREHFGRRRRRAPLRRAPARADPHRRPCRGRYRLHDRRHGPPRRRAPPAHAGQRARDGDLRGHRQRTLLHHGAQGHHRAAAARGRGAAHQSAREGTAGA